MRQIIKHLSGNGVKILSFGFDVDVETQRKFFHTDLDKPFLYGPRFVHGGIVMLKQKRAFPKLLPQSWKHRIV